MRRRDRRPDAEHPDGARRDAGHPDAEHPDAEHRDGDRPGLQPDEVRPVPLPPDGEPRHDRRGACPATLQTDCFPDAVHARHHARGRHGRRGACPAMLQTDCCRGGGRHLHGCRLDAEQRSRVWPVLLRLASPVPEYRPWQPEQPVLPEPEPGEPVLPEQREPEPGQPVLQEQRAHWMRPAVRQLASLRFWARASEQPPASVQPWLPERGKRSSPERPDRRREVSSRREPQSWMRRTGRIRPVPAVLLLHLSR
ncbi:hypothetical protein SAMN04489742_4558 [Arthrobacter crystallopoietes]|uniref:Uncharacterized protein n=1 Tax=Crystallibacter crystallopoietes TaxID=37928 RepID=A0A1H1H3Y9_9MICC|nr:hypothetical protein SAMN04489742_4558 [Arthrobacter crystallopoietes]